MFFRLLNKCLEAFVSISLALLCKINFIIYDHKSMVDWLQREIVCFYNGEYVSYHIKIKVCFGLIPKKWFGRTGSKDIPLKVVIFAWWLFRNRLSTKDNQIRRGVLNNDTCLCASGCGSLETATHLFLHCCIFGSVWHFILRWVGISLVLSYCIKSFESVRFWRWWL